MTEETMPREVAIKMHVSYREAQAGKQILSGFAACLRDARAVTGRDPASGEMLHPENAGTWLGALGYLVLLDQIGKTFREYGRGGAGEDSAVLEALYQFTDLDQREREALYALRNALGHDFALVNLHTRAPIRQHQFALTADGRGPLVQLPDQPWDGDLANRRVESRTWVDLKLLGDLVEGIAQRLFDLAKAGRLDVILPGGSDELVRRYSIWVTS